MPSAKPFKIPESVLVVIHTPDLQVLLIERADHPGYWQSVTGSKDTLDEAPAETARREVLEEVATPPPPEPPKSPRQIACEKKGGRFAKAGNSTTFVCVRETRDGGKACRRETDCEGLCLARSRSCSPITPVLGCQEILTQDGLRVTQCVN